ncbi:winged helix-turn-helix transcriptional regulator [Microterricola viridarii]|uniref:DNA-binding transcriptional regulator, HxlR family n=1 Tax=Microterricola viridarii TaxID=412690 RepID=A0A1H1LJS6_9MICO|nr:helix-turn-helix domain-containing protein [Microterricola viridarii]SDR74687.1 DNA-binding transcriptional regulator, HxlR family [Microterricola viridarii]
MAETGIDGTLEDRGPCSAGHSGSGLIKDVLARIGDKWSLLVIGMLDAGPQRFTALHRNVTGISHRMLTHTLRQLQRDGLVSRTSYPEIPPRVEYEVTPLGRTLIEPVLGLVRWADAHHDEIQQSRAAYDAEL